MQPSTMRPRTTFRVIIFMMFGGLVLTGGIMGCALVRLPNVPLKVTGAGPETGVLAALPGDAAVVTADDWTARRKPLLQALFARNVYGRPPAFGTARVVERRTTAPVAFGKTGKVEELIIALGDAPGAPRFHLALVTPLAAKGPRPVIIMQNFCGNRAALHGLPNLAAPHSPVPSMCTNPFAQPVLELVFGRDINAPPFAKILRRGYAVAIFHAGDVVADAPGRARAQLAALDPGGVPAEASGAIGAWAGLYSRVIDLLSTEPALARDGMIVWGHSRNGKAALLAAANDPRVSAVIALQPGTAGASLQKNGKGETIAQLTGTYPHWLAPAYANYAGREEELPVDQHMLIAMAAPRPVLIGVARRDSWSDPEGSFLAAQGASPVYRLLGGKGLVQNGMKDFTLDGELAFWMRGGLHGVHRSDWRVTLDFLDHWFMPESGQGAGRSG